MEQRNRKRSKRSKTKIIPPKKKRPESLSRDEVRSINKKKIKRKRKAERLALLAALALVVLSIGVVLVLAVFFKIETITIKGDKVYADKEVILQSGIETGDSLIRVNETKINDRLTKNLPYIGDVTIEKKLPDKLVVTVTATREVAAFQSGAGFILVDVQGKVLDKSASMLRDNVAVVNGISPKTATEGEIIELSDEEATNSFLNLLSAIEKSNIKHLTEITSDKNGQWILRYEDRVTIKLSASDNIETDLRRAVNVLNVENERNPYAEGVLDLTMGDKMYFKPGAETTQPASTDVSDKEAQTVSGESTTQKSE